MTLRHFEILKTVAETGNFTKAAQKLYITQSAVSHAIKELEEKAGTPLFDRLSKSVQITKSGQLLLEEIIPILSAYEALEGHIGSLEKKAPIHVVSSITIAIFHLPNILKEFYNQWPDSSVKVDVVSASVAIDKLRIGKADIALIEGADPQGPFICTTFGSYSMEIVCSPNYPLYKKELSIEEFCSEKLLLREQGSAIRDTLDSSLYLSGHTAYPSWCSVNSSALIAATKAGLGITVLPNALVEDDLRNKKLISLTISELSLKNNMSAVWHQDKYLTAPLKTLISIVEDSI